LLDQYQWLRTLGADKSNNVIGVARSPGPVQQKLAADGLTNVTVVQGDMADAVSLRAAAASVHQVTGGKVDYLIVNGTFQMADSGPLTAPDFIGKEDLIRADVLQSAEVNVLGTIYSINAFLSLVKNGTAKKIVAISSGLADREVTLKSGTSSEVVYSAMKAAVNVVVAKFAVALKSDGITLLALSPGVVNTKESLDICISPFALCVIKEEP
jgi:NAD(P)-dependent dehydrogenase (short-subunit alcohol dehydrogenase family)